MGAFSRQTTAFAFAVFVTVCATLALGSDGGLPAYAAGAGLLSGALIAGGRAPMPPVFWLGIGLVAYLTAANAIAGTMWIAGPELAAMAGIAGAFVVGVQAGSMDTEARRAMRILTLVLAALAMAAFGAHVASPDTVFGQAKPYHAGRLTGTFLSANTAATLAAMSVTLGLAGSARAMRGAGGVLRALEAVGRRGLAPATLVLFASACLFLTGSRAGILAGALGAVLVLLPSGGIRRIRLPSLGIALGVGLLLMVASGGVLGDRVADLGAGASGREALWAASIAAWRDAPLFGHGLGSFARALAPHVTAQTAPVLGVQAAAHNVALQWLVQTGLVGTALGALVMAGTVRTLIAGLVRRRRRRWIVRASLAALVVFAVHGLVDYAFEVPAATWWLALLCGLGVGVATGAPGRLKDRRAGPHEG